ncbi:hypothetical protein [Candidatus Regiella insecticola]|uniref:hypothetical protein n=1 Tax=Candidatus Regiella insecticola TaxID=138073 RepID=UPI0002D32CDC
MALLLFRASLSQLKKKVGVLYPLPLKLPLGGQRVRPMSVDILGDSANPRSQQLGGFKGKGYMTAH